MAGGLVPPHNIEAEQSVLGGMLLSQQAVGVAMSESGLTDEDFYVPAHRLIFAAMRKLQALNQPIDLVTLCDMLYREGTMEGVGGVGYVTNLSQQVPTTANMDSYVGIVRDRALLRRLAQTGSTLQQEAVTARKSAHEVLETAEKSLFDIATGRQTNPLMQIQPSVFLVFDQISAAYENKGALQGIDTGFIDLNHALNGFQPSELLLIGARPSVGKTSLLLNFVTSVAIKDNLPVAFFSLEMSREQLVMRMLSMQSTVSQSALRRGDLRDEDFERINAAMQQLAPAPIYIDDTPAITPAEMLSKCRRLKMQHGLGLVMIDYLQLMSGNTRTDNRVAEVSEISRCLKQLARELNVPVLAASQLSRAPDQRKEGHRPMLSDLRESGSIEQDADVVMFLYRDSLYNKEAPINVAELIIAKQRNGPIGTVFMHWQPELTRFSNLARN